MTLAEGAPALGGGVLEDIKKGSGIGKLRAILNYTPHYTQLYSRFTGSYTASIVPFDTIAYIGNIHFCIS